MSTLNEFLRNTRLTGRYDPVEFESVIINELADRSGARRGAVCADSESTVASLALQPLFLTFDIETTVNWISSRMRNVAADVFEAWFTHEAATVCLVARWHCVTKHAGLESRRAAA